MIDKLIGNTPMIKIKYKYKGIERNIYSKLEYYNYTGSIKDRIVLNIIKSAKRDFKKMNELDLFKKLSKFKGDKKFGLKIKLFLLNPKLYYILWKKFKNSI